MNILNTWEFWTIAYLVSAVVFAYNFKIANKNMKDAGSLTILLEVFTGIFSLLMIPLFKIKFEITTSILITLFIVVCIYAVTDRLNTEELIKGDAAPVIMAGDIIFIKEGTVIGRTYTDREVVEDLRENEKIEDYKISYYQDEYSTAPLLQPQVLL